MNPAIPTRALAAALALGAAILSLAPGQAAYAASSNPQEIVRIAIADPDSGGGPEDPASNVERTRNPKHPKDNGIRCAITRPDGSIDFYLPGTEIVIEGRRWSCLDTGKWAVFSRGGGLGDDGSPTTGTNAP